MKIKKITIIYILITVVFGLIIYLLTQIINIKNNIDKESNKNLINITNEDKSFDLQILQKNIHDNVFSQSDCIVSIYAQKNISILNEKSDQEPKEEIKTIKSVQGNGIIISKEGYIITNKHVVGDKNTQYTISINNQEYKTQNIRYDEELDIAVIKIQTNKELPYGKFIKIKNNIYVGDIVFALKLDTENDEIITKIGIINSLKQKFKIKNNRTYVGLIQSSTAIEPGFSGGPLININGEIIAINTAIDNIEYGASYSLPITQEFINQTISSIKESKKIIRPYLGIKYEKYSYSGIIITEIVKNSPADKAGLQIGDIILGINKNNILYNNFLYNLYTYKPGKNIILNIKSGNYEKDVQVRLETKENKSL